MIEILGICLALSGLIFVGLVWRAMRRDLERRHCELEQSLKDEGGVH